MSSEALVSLGVGLAVAAGTMFLGRGSGEVRERLSRFTGDDAKESHVKSLANAGARRKGPFRNSLVLAEKWLMRWEREIAQAGVPLKPREFLTIQLFCLILTPVVWLMSGRPDYTILWLGLVLLVPPGMLKRAKRQRLVQFERQLGDALGTMANSLRAGFSLLQTMDAVSKECQPPLGTEIAKTLAEINLGTSLEEALRRFVRRVDSPDLDLLVTAMIIQRQVGGNQAEVLDKISFTIRERARIRGEIKTLTAQGRMSGMIIGVLPFAMAGFMVMLNPAYIGTLLKYQLGWVMIGTALGMEGLGIFLIRRIIRIEA